MPTAHTPTTSAAEDDGMAPDCASTALNPTTISVERNESRFGAVLAITAAVLAFVLASSVVRAPEIWTHLARGHALLNGLPQPDSNPALLAPLPAGGEYRFALYDLAVYGGFRALNGTGLMVLCAIVATMLAVTLFCVGRVAGRALPAGLCAILAILALAPWLGLTSLLPSCLFLATLTLLLQQIAAGTTAHRSSRLVWLIPVLIVVWANVDRWVVLGPLVVGLYALGTRSRGERRAAALLGRAMVAALVASLLSLNLFAIWDVSKLLRGLNTGPQHSPFWPAWYRSEPPTVGAACVVLALLGLLAFRRNPDRRAVAWAPVWLVLLILSIAVPAAAPFFVVVAVPVAVVALSQFKQNSATRTARKSRWYFSLARWAGRSLMWVSPLLLLAVAWPGLLTGPPFGRPEWSLPVEDSLRDAMHDVTRWRREGVLRPDGRGMTLSPMVAAYGSWFESPTTVPQKAVRMPDWSAVRASLQASNPSVERANSLRSILREHGIDHLIIRADGMAAAEPVMAHLSSLPEEWSLLYLRGRTAVFGWRDPDSRGRAAPAEVQLQPEQRAFNPGREDLAPPAGPNRRPGEGVLLSYFTMPIPVASPGRDEASLYIAYFDGHRAKYDQRNWTAWLSTQSAGQLAAFANPVACPHLLGANIGQWAIGVPGGWETFQANRDDGPLGALLLAVRSCRRAILADPDDAKSYFLLGEAYLRLSGATRERAWRHQLPAFDRIRQVQAITAYRHALALRPDSPAAHGRLARLYRDRGSLDLALRHMDRLLEISRARMSKPGQDGKDAQESFKLLEQEHEALQTEVQRREELWTAGKGNRRTLDLAREASALGLPDHALQLLLKSDASEFGADGVKMELDLLLWAGRVRDVRTWMTPELERTIGATTYHEVLGCAAAALGDYDEAVREMHAVGVAFLDVPSRLPTPHTQAAYDIARAMLTTPFIGNPVETAHAFLVREGLETEVRLIRANLTREANVAVVEGLLALEAGRVEEARAVLGRAVQRSGSGTREERAELAFSGLVVARDCLQLLTGETK